MAILKFHSSLHKYVASPKVKVSLNSCDEVINFLKGTQPNLAKYINRISLSRTSENLMLCDSDGRIITTEESVLKKPADDEILHVVPCVYGGGGKTGQLIIGIALVAAVGFAMAPAGVGAGFLGLSSATQAAGGGAFLKGAALSTFGKIVLGVGVSMTLGGLAQMFTKPPKSAKMENKFDGEARRENDMFGALQNTTDSGTPIPLIYGNTRIAGQLISGYLDVTEHGRDDTVKVSTSFA